MSNGPQSKFAQAIFHQKYAHKKSDGTLETWDDVAHRVASTVLKAVDAPQKLIDAATRLIRERKFMPGGRYLYASGRSFHQTQNCLLMRADDSREGWADLMQKSTMALMTGAGIGVVYSDVRPEGRIIRRTGGHATGPIALMQMVNEAGRGIMQGGSRRSAIWAGLHWNHPDIHKFITLKNWSPEVRALKEKDFNFPATMDGTNISVILDDEFFKAFHDEFHSDHALATSVYWATIKQMLKTAEPGFSIDVGVNNGENLRNAPVCAGTHILTDQGYKDVKSLVGQSANVWTGKQFAKDVVFVPTNPSAKIIKVSMTGGREIRCDETHPFLVERFVGAGERRKLESVDRVPAAMLTPGDILHVAMPKNKESIETPLPNEYALGYVYGDGTFGNNGRNAEITFCSEHSKKCVSTCASSSFFSSVTEKDGRGYTRMYFASDSYWEGRSKAVFPVEVYAMKTPEAASFLAGLFDADGNWEPNTKRIRLASIHEGFLRGVARLLEQHGILAGVSRAGHSTFGQKQTYQLVVMSEYMSKFSALVPTIRIKPNLEGYEAYRTSTVKVLSVEEDGYEEVYCANVGVEEHSFMAEGVIISNCTEITSRDDSDICNLGSINMAQITSLDEMAEAVEVGTAFLLAGTVYSDVPYPKVDEIRRKNRRLGLGLMGLHEWLLKKGKAYKADPELEQYLHVYAGSTEVAHKYADEWGISRPVKTRAIAPTGTIGIIAETTTGIEPLFCVAYKRRYLKGNVTHYQYVVDGCARRLIESGVDPEKIEDCYVLAENVEQRVAFQAWLQKFVDHSISSTVNLPAWGSEKNNSDTMREFGEMLIKYLPDLRGITTYPDGARGGQPLTPCSYAVARRHEGNEYAEEQVDICDLTKGGSCSS